MGEIGSLEEARIHRRSFWRRCWLGCWSRKRPPPAVVDSTRYLKGNTANEEQISTAQRTHAHRAAFDVDLPNAGAGRRCGSGKTRRRRSDSGRGRRLTRAAQQQQQPHVSALRFRLGAEHNRAGPIDDDDKLWGVVTRVADSFLLAPSTCWSTCCWQRRSTLLKRKYRMPSSGVVYTPCVKEERKSKGLSTQAFYVWAGWGFPESSRSKLCPSLTRDTLEWTKVIEGSYNGQLLPLECAKVFSYGDRDRDRGLRAHTSQRWLGSALGVRFIPYYLGHPYHWILNEGNIDFKIWTSFERYSNRCGFTT